MLKNWTTDSKKIASGRSANYPRRRNEMARIWQYRCDGAEHLVSASRERGQHRKEVHRRTEVTGCDIYTEEELLTGMSSGALVNIDYYQHLVHFYSVLSTFFFSGY